MGGRHLNIPEVITDASRLLAPTLNRVCIFRPSIKERVIENVGRSVNTSPGPHSAWADALIHGWSMQNYLSYLSKFGYVVKCA